MRRIFSILIVALVVVSCKDDPEPSSTAYPTEALTLDAETNSLLMVEYSSTTSGAATADLIRANLEHMFPDNVTHFSIPSVSTDPLYTPYADSLSDHFGGKLPFTFLLNGAAKTLPEIQASLDEIQDNISTKPLLSVGHVSHNTDTAWVADVLVEFHKDTVTPFLYVEAYLLADIEATTYDAGALDLRLTPNSNLVATPDQHTKWVQDTYNTDTTTVLFSANSTYIHKRIFLAGANGVNAFGTPLSDFSKFGAEFFRGDKIGLKQNPIQLYFLKTDFDHLDFAFTPRIVTVVWNYDFVDQKFEYVNSYMD